MNATMDRFDRPVERSAGVSMRRERHWGLFGGLVGAVFGLGSALIAVYVSASTQYLLVLLLSGVLVWQLVSGWALGAWWYPRITRQDNPAAYWFVLASQGAVIIVILLTGRLWHMR